MEVDRLTPLGTVKEKVPQMKIWAQLDSQPRALVGYVGTKPGSPINIIVPDLPVSIVEEIKAQVESQLNSGDKLIAVPPTTDEINELIPPEDALDDELLEDDESQFSTLS
jgi:hypothetical protein